MKRISIIKAIIDKNGNYSHNVNMFINTKISNYNNSNIKIGLTEIANSHIHIRYISGYKGLHYTLYSVCDEFDILLEDYSNETIKTGFKFKAKRKKISDYNFIQEKDNYITY